jgi:hypothetical protein
MVVRLLPWQPNYGSTLSFDTELEPDPLEPLDITIERAVWAPVTPDPAPDVPVQIVDGVRRAEAHALDDGPDGAPLFGLFGSYAVGAVRCAVHLERRARIPEESIRVERRYLHVGELVPDRVISSGAATVYFAARRVPNATSAQALVGALNRAMLDEEALLAAELSRDESVLTLVDGPLRSLRSPGRRIVGYVKRIQQWYVSTAERELLPTLEPGERTPLFLIPPGSGLESVHAEGRYSWFMRLRQLNRIYHPLGGVMRLETSGSLPLAEAVALADETTRLLPRLSSAPGTDPRAPHNLVPVGALESVLTHRLGDRRWVQRLLTAHVARDAREVVYA